MEPGIYRDIDSRDYHAWPGVSNSRLKRFAEAPAKLAVPRPSTSTLKLGRLKHCAVLEPQNLPTYYAVMDTDRLDARTKAYIAFAAENPGREIIKRSEYDEALALSRAVRSHPAAAKILSPGFEAEVSFVWDDAASGLRCKGRADILHRSWGMLADIKTTEDAGPEAVAKTIATYKYHWQDTFYRTGLSAAGVDATAFVFIFVENKEPYLTACYEIDWTSRGFDDNGRAIDLVRTEAEIASYLASWRECEVSGQWPGHANGIVPIPLPAWTFKGISQ